jgi:hypothetical protein
MLAKLDRDEFMALLEKLGDEDDETVLTAARDVHARLTVADVSWDDLLVPDEDEEDDEEDWSDEDFGDTDEDVAATSPAGADDDQEPVNDEEKAEALALIGKLEGRQISAETKTELKEYRDDIAAGQFEKMDLRYLRALHARLAKGK